MEVEGSTLSNVDSSTFDNNGKENKLAGGSFEIKDSAMSVTNTILSGNKAMVGAAIHFSCSSTVL